MNGKSMASDGRLGKMNGRHSFSELSACHFNECTEVTDHEVLAGNRKPIT